MKIFFLLITCFFTTSLFAQTTGSFTDPRDGQQYETIVVGGKKWMRENLRYQTATSYCPNFNKDPKACALGNYYLNTEADKVCPPGWSLPTLEDWQAYIDELVQLQLIHKDSMKTVVGPSPHFSTLVEMGSFNILKDTLLRFKPVGWVQGNKVDNKKSTSIWVNNLQTNDNKYHIHLALQRYVIHTHEHHVIDKPRKIRKFTIRCVCSLNQEKS